jgi:hypothetical protein
MNLILRMRASSGQLAARPVASVNPTSLAVPQRGFMNSAEMGT